MRALTASLRALLLAAATFAPLGLGGTNPGATYPGPTTAGSRSA